MLLKMEAGCNSKAAVSRNEKLSFQKTFHLAISYQINKKSLHNNPDYSKIEVSDYYFGWLCRMINRSDPLSSDCLHSLDLSQLQQ